LVEDKGIRESRGVFFSRNRAALRCAATSSCFAGTTFFGVT